MTQTLAPGSATLCDLADDIAFFTPALIYTHGGFDRCVVSLFNLENPAPEDELAFAIDSAWPLFSGLEEMNNQLYGITRARRDELIAFVTKIGFYNPVTKSLWGVFAHHIAIVDPSAHAGLYCPDARTVPLTVFGVISPAGYWMLAQSACGLPSPRFEAGGVPGSQVGSLKEFVA